MSTLNEQKLVDICFEIALMINDPKYRDGFSKLNGEDTAKYVSKQLEGCGFPTRPVGMSWGVLIDKEN